MNIELTSKDYTVEDMRWGEDRYGPFYTFSFFKTDDPDNIDTQGVSTTYFEIVGGKRESKEAQIAELARMGWTLRGFRIVGHDDVSDLYKKIVDKPYIRLPGSGKKIELPEFVKTPDEPSAQDIADLDRKVKEVLASIAI